MKTTMQVAIGFVIGHVIIAVLAVGAYVAATVLGATPEGKALKSEPKNV